MRIIFAACALFMVVSGAFFVRAESLSPVTERAFFVFPSNVVSKDWENIETLYSQDYDSTALFQEFKRSDSSYPRASTRQDSDTEEVSSPAEEVGGDEPLEPSSETPGETEVVDASGNEEGDVEDVEPVPAPEPEASEETAPVDEPASSEPISLLNAPLKTAGNKLSLLFAQAVDRAALVLVGSDETAEVIPEEVESVEPDATAEVVPEIERGEVSGATNDTVTPTGIAPVETSSEA